ncbi:MAG: hypothetical protein WD875_14220, partial [Pirellulales bacterium]
IATLLVLPAWLFYRAGALVLGRQRAFSGWSQAMSLIPGLSGEYLRRAFYRLCLPECGAGVVISFGTVFSHPTARLGRNVYLGVYCSIGDATIEADVLVASHVSIVNGGRQHAFDRLDVPIREQTGDYPRVSIGRGAWIGERSVIMADVGQHSVVGAGSVVVKSVEAGVIAAGVPCRLIRRRGDAEPHARDPEEVGVTTSG